MLVTQARRLVYQGGLQVNHDTYGTVDVDHSIAAIGNDFVEHCSGVTRTTGTAALVGSSRAVDCGSISQFSPENAVRVTVIDYDGIERPVKIVDYDTILSDIAAQGTTTGTAVPTRIAFETVGSIGYINYTPGTAASRVVIYHDPPFTTWTYGDSASGTVPLNIPDRWCYPIFHDGAPAFLQTSDPLTKANTQGWKRYLEHRTYAAGRIGNDQGALISDPNAYL